MFKYFFKIFRKNNSNNYNLLNENETIEMALYLDVENENIKYDFDEYWCHKELTGICSLELETPFLEYKDKDFKKGNFNYCRDLAESFKEVGILSPINISQGKDNVCTIQDGLHRVCIARHLKIDVPAFFSFNKKNLYKYINCRKFEK